MGNRPHRRARKLSPGQVHALAQLARAPEAIVMTEGEHLIICGASTRAAAFSAIRAGLKPWCIDLFADEDLKAKCPVMPIPRAEYPHKLPEGIERHAVPGPWMYTGRLENNPRTIRANAKLMRPGEAGHEEVRSL